MAPHSSTLAWKIPWMEEPDRLQSMGLLRVRHDWVTFHFHALEKEMATHSSVLAWRIPGIGEPGGLPSMGLHRVRHDWSDLAAWDIEYISLCNAIGPCCLSILCIVVYICSSQTPNLSISLVSPLVTINLFSISVIRFLLSLFVSFLKDSTYKWYHMIVVFLCLTYFT